MDMLKAELRGHLLRLAFFSIISIVVGGFGAVLVQEPALRSFAFMNTAWGAVNIIICAASWKSSKPLELRPLREFLTFNLGLNFGWIMLGLPMAFLGGPEIAGSGWGIALQGLLLLVLDFVLLRRLPLSAES